MATTNLKSQNIVGIEYQSGNGSPTHSASNNTRYIDLDTGYGYTKTSGGWFKTSDSTNQVYYAGTVTQPTITDNGTGLINIGSCVVNLFPSSNNTGPCGQFTIPALNNQQLTANTYYYIIANYNSGTPIFQIITDNNLITHSDIINIIQINWQNESSINMLHKFSTGNYGLGLPNKTGHRLIHTERFGYESGLGVTKDITNHLLIEAGRLWYDGEMLSFSPVDTNSTQFIHYFKTAGVWTPLMRNTLDVTNYNNGTNLVPLSGGRYSKSWIYRCVGDNGTIFVLSGEGDYRSSDLATAIEPSKPPLIAKMGVLLSSIVIIKNGTTITEQKFWLENQAFGSSVVDHNSTLGIDGAGTYHLTQSAAATAETGPLATIGNVTGDLTGVADGSQFNITFNNTNRTASFTPTGTTFDVYYRGTKFTKTGVQTFQIADVEGIHMIYCNASGVLSEFLGYDDQFIDTYAPMSILYWDATNKVRIAISNEKHHVSRNRLLHRNIHNSIGVGYATGLALSGITIGNGSSDSHLQFTVTNGELYDEDIEILIVNNTPQQLSILNAPILYLSGTNWRRDSASTLPYKSFVGGGGRLAYNLVSGGNGSQVECADNTYVIYYAVASSDLDYPLMMVQGRNNYNSVSAATQNFTLEANALLASYLPIVEPSLIGAVLVKTSSSFTNTKKASIVPNNDGNNYFDMRTNYKTNKYPNKTVFWNGREIVVSLTNGDFTTLKDAVDWFNTFGTSNCHIMCKLVYTIKLIL